MTIHRSHGSTQNSDANGKFFPNVFLEFKQVAYDEVAKTIAIQ